MHSVKVQRAKALEMGQMHSVWVQLQSSHFVYKPTYLSELMHYCLKMNLYKFWSHTNLFSLIRFKFFLKIRTPGGQYDFMSVYSFSLHCELDVTVLLFVHHGTQVMWHVLQRWWGSCAKYQYQFCTGSRTISVAYPLLPCMSPGIFICQFQALIPLNKVTNN